MVNFLRTQKKGKLPDGATRRLLVADETRERTTGGEPADMDTRGDDATHLLILDVLLLGELGETPVVGDVNLLAAGELHLSATKSLHGNMLLLLATADGHEHGADLDTSSRANRLTEGATHTSLETIGSSAGKHLVDTDDVEGMDTHTEMEKILTSHLDHVLVAGNTSSLESLRRDLLNLVGNHVHRARESLGGGPLVAHVVDADLGIGHTTTVAGLRVRLGAAHSVTTRRTATHR
jgi:hypothetical protein